MFRNEDRILLFPKAFEVLLYLVQHSGSLVEKQELREAVWDGVVVEDGNLCVAVSMLRKALGPDQNGQHYIQTVPKFGYRFVAEVRSIVRLESSLALGAKEPDLADPLEEELSPQRIANTVPTKAGAGPVEVLAKRGSPNTPQIQHWLFGAAVFLMVAATTVYVSRSLRSQHSQVLASQSEPIRSLGILPFTTVGEQDNAYLGIGLSTEVASKLASLGKVLIRPSSSMAKYTSARDPQNCGKRTKSRRRAGRTGAPSGNEGAALGATGTRKRRWPHLGGRLRRAVYEHLRSSGFSVKSRGRVHPAHSDPRR